MNVWLAPPISVAVVGLTLTAIGVSVTVAIADLVVSVLLVAVTVADVVVMTAGAVYTPAEVIVPGEADQVTPALAVSFVTVAVKVCAAPAASVAVAGLTVTLIAGAEEPPHPAKRANAANVARTYVPMRGRHDMPLRGKRIKNTQTNCSVLFISDNSRGKLVIETFYFKLFLKLASMTRSGSATWVCTPMPGPKLDWMDG